MPTTADEHHVIGPLGSEFWRIKVSPELVPALAREFDWNRLGRRVMIDSLAGIITWMNPSSLHAGMADATDEIVKAAGPFIRGGVKGMRDTRWKRPEDPMNVGLEADAAFYIGDTAEQWFAVYRKGGEEAVERFEEQTPPDLVVEVEVTHLDGDKPNRYAKLGVREMWRVSRNAKSSGIVLTILDLQEGGGPRTIEVSQVLLGLSANILPEAYRLARAGILDELNALLGRFLVSHKPGQNVTGEVGKAEPSRPKPRM